ncbi:MAG: hypothetical protein JSR77_11695 [Planctomycetes bacterium]|nr:hypothetical protein [Planctomycetota bacterium]
MRARTSLVLAASVVAALAGAALADGRVTIQDATGVYNGTDGSGGAFQVWDAGPAANGNDNGSYGGNLLSGDGRGTGSNSFLSFCIEIQDHLSFGGTYYTQISSSAYDSEPPVNLPNPDPLSGTTAKLYSEFRSIANGTASTAGLFGGLMGATLTSQSTTDLQNAIWYSEGEKAWGDISAAAQALYTWAAANNDGALHGVRVLRLWTNYNAQTGEYSGSHQDLLTCIPLPPAAYAGLGTFASIFALAAVRRRKLAVE